MRREFTNMKTKIAGDLVESSENIEKLKSDIVETKEQAQKTTNDIADALTASLAKSSGHARMVSITEYLCHGLSYKLGICLIYTGLCSDSVSR